MRFIAFCLYILSSSCLGQTIKETITKKYYSDTENINYQWSYIPEVFSIKLNIGSVVSPGTDNRKDATLTAYIGNDTLVISDSNYPFAKKTTVTIETPNGQGEVIFRFNASPSDIPMSHIIENTGIVHFEIPEVYELANIIWSLSPSGRGDNSLRKNSQYYNEVLTYFEPFLDHQIFKELDFEKSTASQKYYEFRENSFMFEFQEDEIIHRNIYNYVYGNDWENFTNIFSKLKPLVQDFAVKSNFRDFYKNHLNYYNNQVDRAKELLPIKNMWSWLEREFPNRKQDSYQIIFSPLIGGSHSTQNYQKLIDWETRKMYRESIMFICGAERYDSNNEWNEKQKEGLFSGVVFTEIDHNYVNPVSSKFQQDINDIFSEDGFWAAADRNSYRSPISVFNEYMTHSVFCLWVENNYESQIAEFIINKREEMNADRRGFLKFREFNAALSHLRESHPKKTVVQLYPEILLWSKNFKQQH